MISLATRNAWRAQALQAAHGIARGQDEFACIALAEGDPDFDGENADCLNIVGLFTDAFRPTNAERNEYQHRDSIAWLASDSNDVQTRTLALLFFREMLGTPGALSGPDFFLQA